MDGVLPIDKPAGLSSHDVVAAVRRSLGGVRDRPRRNARPVRHRPAARSSSGGPPRPSGELMDLPKRYETRRPARRAVEHRRHRGGDHRDRADPADRPPCRPARSASARRRHSAVKVGGERAYRRARRGESFEMPERIVTVHCFRELWRERERGGAARAGYADRVRVGHLRALADRRPRRRLLPAAAAHRDRPVRRRGRRRPAPARRTRGTEPPLIDARAGPGAGTRAPRARRAPHRAAPQ